MESKEYFNILVNDIHTVVLASVDDNYHPITTAIDMMDYDDYGIFFLTAKGKSLYERLKKNSSISLTGIRGNNTLSSVALSLRGKALEVGNGLLPKLFEKNSYMKEIYPNEESRKALTVFKIVEGNGELFDLSKKPIERKSFSFGRVIDKFESFYVTSSCVSCGLCLSVCPQNCITFDNNKALIHQENCLHCGACLDVCPNNAIRKKEQGMNQDERRVYLIKYLLNENPEYRKISIPNNATEQWILLRSLMNIRESKPINSEFLLVQDQYLQTELSKKKITRLSDLDPIKEGIYIYKGDITCLSCGAIVNAANSGLTGCYQPCHNCIDNCIHTYAGMQLRFECSTIMRKQGCEEDVGKAKITNAYNLPCNYVIHTVGPIVRGKLTDENCKALKSCYTSCLKLADQNKIKSIAFCCISTGVFCFPNEKAAEIAVSTVDEYLINTKSDIKVIFNVFKDEDEQIYRKLLQ